MFRSRAIPRSFKQNLRLAAFLSFVAGIVNICGVLGLGVLTTNITGHFAYFSQRVLTKTDELAFFFLFYILSFLLGSFTSSFITEYFARANYESPHHISIYIEIGLLLLLGLYGEALVTQGVHNAILACCMLFAMGLQNSLVTRVSNAAVRTTHLTGLFTDLGIELSQLFFYKEGGQRKKLVRSIGLRCAIIGFFFLGCFSGDLLYPHFQFRILLIGVLTLFLALIYDSLRLGVYRLTKRFQFPR